MTNRVKVVPVTLTELDLRIASLRVELDQILSARDIHEVAGELSSCLFLRDGTDVSVSELIG